MLVNNNNIAASLLESLDLNNRSVAEIEICIDLFPISESRDLDLFKWLSHQKLPPETLNAEIKYELTFVVLHFAPKM